MNEHQLDRYSRQILLANFDYEGQQRLLNAHVLIIGMGGLGNIAASYLVASGIGELTIVDADTIENSNLQRQVLYREKQIGSAKVDAAVEQLHELNSETRIQSFNERVDQHGFERLMPSVDLVLDCTDNFTTRQLINRVCQTMEIPLVSGAAIRWEGQLISFLYHQQDSPCYECLYPSLSDAQLSCSESGIISPVVGTIGVLQALDAIKIISGCGEVIHGALRLFDGFSGKWRDLSLTKDPDCKICSKD